MKTREILVSFIFLVTLIYDLCLIYNIYHTKGTCPKNKKILIYTQYIILIIQNALRLQKIRKYEIRLVFLHNL